MITDYSMAKFTKLAATRQDQIDEMIIETLTGLDNFDTFKERVIERKIYIMSSKG